MGARLERESLRSRNLLDSFRPPGTNSSRRTKMTKNTTTNNYRIRADQLQNLEIDRNGRVTPRLHDLDPFQNTLLSVLYPGIKVASVNVPAGPLDDYEEAQVENALARLVWNSVHYKLVGASGSAKKGKFYFVDQEHSRASPSGFNIGRKRRSSTSEFSSRPAR